MTLSTFHFPVAVLGVGGALGIILLILIVFFLLAGIFWFLRGRV